MAGIVWANRTRTPVVVTLGAVAPSPTAALRPAGIATIALTGPRPTEIDRDAMVTIGVEQIGPAMVTIGLQQIGPALTGREQIDLAQTAGRTDRDGRDDRPRNDRDRHERNDRSRTSRDHQDRNRQDRSRSDRPRTTRSDDRSRAGGDRSKRPSDPKVGESVYIANLPWQATDADLKAMFAPHGKVHTSSVIIDSRSGRSKGFGFVDMSKPDAENAIKALDGTKLEGRAIAVRFAKPRTYGN